MSDDGSRLGSLLQSSVLVFVGLVVGNGLALLAETLIARSLPPAQYGHLALAYTIALIGGRLAIVGVKDGVTRFVSAADDYDHRKRVFHHGVVIVVTAGLVAAFVIVLARGVLASAMDDPKLPTYLLVFAPFVVLYPLGRVAYGMLRAEGAAAYGVISRDLAGRLVPIGLLAVALLVGAPELGALAYWLAVPTVLFLTATLLLRGEYPLFDLLTTRIDRSTLRELWSFSWPLAASSYIFILLTYLDIVMIGFFLESADVGHYRAIQPLRMAATLLMTAFTFLFLPTATEYFESGDIAGLADFYTVSTKWLAAGTFPIVLVFGLYAEDVVRTLFGTPYLPAAPALALLVLGLFTRVIVGLDGDVVKAIDRTEIELVSALVGLVANFALNVTLIPRIGIAGAALATAAGFTVYNAVEVAAIYRILGIHPFSWNNFKPLVFTGIVAIGLWWLTRGMTFGIIGLVAIGAIIGIVQLGSMVLTRSLDDTDIEMIEHFESQLGVDLGMLKRAL